MCVCVVYGVRVCAVNWYCFSTFKFFISQSHLVSLKPFSVPTFLHGLSCCTCSQGNCTKSSSSSSFTINCTKLRVRHSFLYFFAFFCFVLFCLFFGSFLGPITFCWVPLHFAELMEHSTVKKRKTERENQQLTTHTYI